MLEGELEIGQVASLIKWVKPVNEIIEDIVKDFNLTSSNMANLKLPF